MRPGDRRASAKAAWYDEYIKVHEYAGLIATAREIRSAGCPVVIVAPFTSQIHDIDRWTEMVDALGGEPVRLIWVHCDAATLRARIVARGSVRDAAKLADFTALSLAIRLTEPPAVAHIDVDTSSGRDTDE